MRLLFAFRVFFQVLFRREVADRVREVLNAGAKESVSASTTQPASVSAPETKPGPRVTGSSRTARSEALTLLSTLQRESRLLDLVCESLDAYGDAQIGAAARDVLRDSRKALDRMFGLKRLMDSEEGTTIDLPSNPNPVRWRIMGSASASRGTLNHSGWQATKLDIPQWSGGTEDAMVIAPAEVET